MCGGFGTPAGGVAGGTAWPSTPNDTNAVWYYGMV